MTIPGLKLVELKRRTFRLAYPSLPFLQKKNVSLRKF